MSVAFDVAMVRDVLARRTGLDLGRGGMQARLESYVKQRLESRGFSYERYLEEIAVYGSDELLSLCEAMTVVYTWFFRDPGQFGVIEQVIREFSGNRPMAIWVAGCATGEEAYSVALVASQLKQRVEILGTDINTSALKLAQAGRYGPSSLNSVETSARQRYLDMSATDYAVPESIKESVRFQYGNLVEAAPRPRVSEGWDLVICRNVLIYFSADQARKTLDALGASLAFGGTLVLGASEAILERPTSLKVTGIAGRAVLVRPRENDPSPNKQGQETRSYQTPREANARSAAAGQFLRPLAHIAPTAALSRRSPVRAMSLEGSEPQHDVQSAIDAGHASLEVGDVMAAIQHYLRAASGDPTNAEALMHSGIAYYLEGDFERALSQLRGALCVDNELWPAHFFQALSYENMGFAKDAARSYAQVVKLAQGRHVNVREYPFLKGWRNDLISVAAKRALLGSAGAAR